MSKLSLNRMQRFIILLVLILEFEIIAEKDEKPKEPEVTTPAPKNGEETFNQCYSEIGCVNADETWFDKKLRPVNLKPLDREVIKTQFLLLKKNRTFQHSTDIFSQVVTTSTNSLDQAGFTKGSFLFLLIHDFTSSGDSGWIKHITKVLKSRTKKCNVISVDWHAGAQPPYDQAVANARVVALEIIFLLKFLKENHQLTMEQVHVIGHGVGAHIAGYIGYSLKTHKITGLDPSGPRFEEMPIHVRLDQTDAQYVEVLHTDAMGYNSQGTKQILGHTDFFLNNADTQPGCPAQQTSYDILSVTRATLNEGEVMPGCSHKRAYKYYIESLEVEECTFLGIKCENYLEFRRGKCTSCGSNCRTFGLVTYSEPNNGSYFLQTDAQRPYCLYQYRVTVQVRADKSSYFGFFQFILIDKHHYTTTSTMLDPREFKPGGENNFVFYAGVPEMGKIIEAKVGWREKSKLFCVINCKQVINVDKITIQSINSNTKNSQEVSLCPKDDMTEIQNGNFQDFVVCKK